MTNGTEGIRKQASELIEQAYQRGYKVGKDEAYKSPLLTKDAYMQGMNVAWNALQKFYEMSNADMESIGLHVNDMVSPHSNIYYILQNISANEALDLIRAYEEKQKKQEEEEPQEFNSCDECIHSNDSEEKCIERRCVHAIKTRDCFKKRLD